VFFGKSTRRARGVKKKEALRDREEFEKLENQFKGGAAQKKSGFTEKA